MKELTEIQSQGNKGESWQKLGLRLTLTLPLSPPALSTESQWYELLLFYFPSSQELWGNSPNQNGRPELLLPAAFSRTHTHTHTHTQTLLPRVLLGMNTGLKVTNTVLALPPL